MPIKVECQHCKHIWSYKGKKQYATCPDCLYKVNVKKQNDKLKNFIGLG